MPHVSIRHFPKEFTDEQRERLAKAITAVISENFGVDRGAVSIALEPVPESDWKAAVATPEIKVREHLLIQAPSYLDNDRSAHENT